MNLSEAALEKLRKSGLKGSDLGLNELKCLGDLLINVFKSSLSFDHKCRGIQMVNSW